MKMEIKTEKLEIEKQLFDAEYYLPGKFITMQHFNDKLFLFPLYGQSVYIYDLKQKSIETIQLEVNTKLGYPIFSSAIVKDKIIGIPGRYPRFIVMDGINNIKKEIEFEQKKLNEIEVYKSVYFTKSNYVYDDVLFMGSLMSNYIVSLSLGNYEIEYHRLECIYEKKKGIYTLCGSGHELYVLGNDGKLRIYELLKGSLLLKKVVSVSCITLGDGSYANSLYSNGKFMMFSNDGIVICDIYSGEVKKYSLKTKNKVKSTMNTIGFLYAYKSVDGIRAMSAMDFVEYLFDENMVVIDKKQYFVKDSELNRLSLYPLVEEKQKEIYIGNLDFLIKCLILE